MTRRRPDSSFTFDNGRTPQRMFPRRSRGRGLVDYDGDGWLDVYCVQGGGRFPGTAPTRADLGGPPATGSFRNLGDGTFKDATGAPGLAGSPGGGLRPGRDRGRLRQRRPSGPLRHPAASVMTCSATGETARSRTSPSAAGWAGPRRPTSAAFADLDNDGDLDLYVCHYVAMGPDAPRPLREADGEPIYCDPRRVEPAADHVFRNDSGRFVDVTAAAGFTDRDGRGLGVVAADLDGDGLVDLYVANDGTANYLFRNLGADSGSRRSAIAAGVAGNADGGYQAGMGVACGDLDGDGRPDLMVTNFYGEGTTLYRNLGDGACSPTRARPRVWPPPAATCSASGSPSLDVNNDGRLDLVMANGHVNGPPAHVPISDAVQAVREAVPAAVWSTSRTGREPPWKRAPRRPRAGRRRPGQRWACRCCRSWPRTAHRLFPQPTERTGPLPDAGARRDENTDVTAIDLTGVAELIKTETDTHPGVGGAGRRRHRPPHAAVARARARPTGRCSRSPIPATSRSTG